MATHRHKGIFRAAAVCAVSLLLCLAAATESHAAGAVPDGMHSLAEIFPALGNTALAEDIADQIGAPDTNYIPTSQSEFDGITTVSLPDSGLEGIDGIQYCGSLEYLFLPGNMLRDGALGALGGMQSLLYLDLSGNNISDAGAQLIAQMSNRRRRLVVNHKR